jgi:hypothetical protein
MTKRGEPVIPAKAGIQKVSLIKSLSLGKKLLNDLITGGLNEIG